MYPVVALILSSIWLAWTVLVDFFVVPSVFQHIPDFFLAGGLGVIVFNKLNTLEFPLASVLFVSIVMWIRQSKQHKYLLLINFVLVGIAALYLFSLTPKLTHLTAAWEYADKMGTLGSNGQDVQQLHQSYHQTYIALDTVKLLLLSAQTLVLGVFLSRRTR